MTLRTVKPGEKAPKKDPPKDVADAARNGTHLELLITMRDRIADSVSKDSCPPRDLAALTRRLQEIVREIEQIEQMEREEAKRGGPVEDGYFDASTV